MSIISYSFLDEVMTENDIKFYQKLGERVATLRKEHHITQVQMAEILGISQQLVAANEAGRRKIPVAMLPKIAQLFGLSIDELLGFKKSATKPGPVAVLNQQVERIKHLPRTKQKFVMEMLDTVIKQQTS